MSEERPEYRRDLWLPGLVGLLGIVLSLGAWGALVSERRATILAATQKTADDLQESVERALADQVAMLDGMARPWEEFGPAARDEWAASVAPQVEQIHGLVSVAWVGLDDEHERITAGAAASPREVAIDLEEVRRRHPERALLGPERDATGALGYRILLPVRADGGREGMLVARFRTAPLLDALLQARAEGLALSASWNGERIYARGEPSVDPWQEWWRVETIVDLPLGGHWRITHRPTAQLATASLPPVPHYLLAAGVLLSIVLAVVAHQLRVILRQARFLAATNRALEQRGLELESKVAERTHALEEAVKELEAFNYSVSHDLRSPLGAIQNFTAILEEDYRGEPLDDEAMAILARIQRSAVRATGLLEDLLQLSRAGRAALTVEPIDMTALAREVFAQVRAAAADGGDVELFVAPLPVVAGDRSLLGDVFANLFSNAIKYSRGREKRRVTVSGRTQGIECVYSVADNGHGFDMRFADKLFGLFERLDTKANVEGTGVGLAMVSRIVRRHGGRVWAEGRPGDGACFWFALPRREV